MNRHDFDALIARLEKEAVEDPGWYRTRVMAFTALGFAAVGMVALVAAAAIAVAIWCFLLAGHHPRGSGGMVKIGIFSLIIGIWLGWVLVRALWVRFDHPDGLIVTASEAPELHQTVERIRRQIGAPAIHRIRVVGGVNASLVQTPRLGPLGWYRNELVLGQALLRLLTPTQASAVVAHELGHLVGGHGRAGAWIYRLRSTWSTLHERLAASHGGGPVRWFLDWYAPRYNAWTFVLARQQEREADRIAATVAGSEAAGQALIRTSLMGRTEHERFWPEMHLLAARQMEPPGDLSARLAVRLAAADPTLTRWQREALAESTGRADTHPCLRERLKLTGASDRAPPSPPPLSASSAVAWLGMIDGDLARRLDLAWENAANEGWQARYSAAQEELRKRADLERKGDTATIDERFTLARLIEDLDGESAARPRYESVLAAKPEHAPALFALGRILLNDGDSRGLDLLDKARQIDLDAAPAALELQRLWHDRHGQAEQVRAAEIAADRQQEEDAQAHAERSQLPAPSRLQPHELDEAALAPIRARLHAEPEVFQADLAKVAVQHRRDRPPFVVTFRIRSSWWRWRSADANIQLAQRLAEAMPMPCWVIDAKGQQAALAKAVAKLAGARIFERST